jgi:hypothetical protein
MRTEDPAQSRKSTVVFSYGGGRQSVCLILLCKNGVLPWPDHIVMADTGRENQSTWRYHEQHIAPILNAAERPLEIAGPSYAKVGTHAHNGQLLLPVYSEPRGKYSAYCSNEWKRRVRDRYLAEKGIRPDTLWLGLGFEERRRWERVHNTHQGKTLVKCPLVDLELTTAQALQILARSELPPPPHSSCFFCPNKSDHEWLALREQDPSQFEQACKMDDELRAESIEEERGPIYLHHSRTPLREALDRGRSDEIPRRCDGEGCFT